MGPGEGLAPSATVAARVTRDGRGWKPSSGLTQTDAMDSAIDRLYQLPLEAFTKARNELAKTLKGDEKSAVTALVKPTAPVWAINQLHGKDRATYKALVDASERLRTAHRAVLAGKKADLRKADELHRAALERALAKTVSFLEQAAGRVSDASRDAIRRTLAALPTDEQAGRLTREPEPAGFSLFEGVKPKAAKVAARGKGKTAPPQPDAATIAQEKRREREAREHAAREERERVARAETARKQLAKARQAAERAAFNVRKAEAALETARAEETAALRALKDAERNENI